MIRAVADTHAVIWYLFGDPRLSVKARDVIDGAARTGNHVAVSAISVAELIYLTEKDRLSTEALDRLLGTLQQGGVLAETPFDLAVAQMMRSVPRSQVPDFPDRIIAATGLRLGVPVISRDSQIQASDVPTIW